MWAELSGGSPDNKTWKKEAFDLLAFILSGKFIYPVAAVTFLH